MDAIEKRFWDKVEKTDKCWLWKASISNLGYGKFQVYSPKRWLAAHRVAYELAVGPIPQGLVIDHLCCNKRCVNPEHLEPVTIRENIRRARVGIERSIKDCCPRGHEYTLENTYYARQCKTCMRKRHHKH